MFTAAFFTITKRYKPKCPSTDDENAIGAHDATLLSHKKEGNSDMRYDTINLEDVMLSEINRVQMANVA